MERRGGEGEGVGEEVFVLGRSQRRGYLVVEHASRHVHIPHHYTELRVSGEEGGSGRGGG